MHAVRFGNKGACHNGVIKEISSGNNGCSATNTHSKDTPACKFFNSPTAKPTQPNSLSNTQISKSQTFSAAS
jgi:hypothetical protein